MSTRALDKLSDEMQRASCGSAKRGSSADACGRRPQLSGDYMSALPVGADLNLLVKYRVPDVSDTQRAFDDNMAVIRAIVARLIRNFARLSPE